VVSLVAGRSGRKLSAVFYNRYKIVVYTGLRSDSIKNHVSRKERNDSLYDEAHGNIVSSTNTRKKWYV
jgi:hypothetical protein